MTEKHKLWVNFKVFFTCTPQGMPGACVGLSVKQLLLVQSCRSSCCSWKWFLVSNGLRDQMKQATPTLSCFGQNMLMIGVIYACTLTHWPSWLHADNSPVGTFTRKCESDGPKWVSWAARCKRCFFFKRKARSAFWERGIGRQTETFVAFYQCVCCDALSYQDTNKTHAYLVVLAKW